ncbi:AraC family transcriptional regulator [Siphonobacter curvatus]|uniref:AraC family transcriptional regulator n=2 Tax=Siphonobacter curvatus TaxID=2094562 RepID=A0A2S7IKA7_9BACT|nr:AraC family transcriptional regulator [Siphonobacter curvatus]
MKAPQTHVFKTITELLEYLKQPKPLHPLIALVSYQATAPDLEQAGAVLMLDFYKISFKTRFNGQVRYGPGYYDFQEGGLAFLAPHQLVTMTASTDSYEGFALYFHPDLIRTYPLGKTIRQYHFFSYDVSEALFLSASEKEVITSLFDSIQRELHTNIDAFSQDVLVSQLELLLHHSNRYYNRQFLTRKAVHHDLINTMDAYLISRFSQPLNGIPTVQEVADHVKVSPRYLTDMLKTLRGLSTQQYIHNQLIEAAKTYLSTSGLTVAEIAYHLGFEHPQSFSKLFKSKTRLSPVAFRQSFRD